MKKLVLSLIFEVGMILIGLNGCGGMVPQKRKKHNPVPKALIKDKAKRGRIMADIYQIQKKPHPEAIQRAFELFDVKWRMKKSKHVKASEMVAVNTFLDYFRDQWTVEGRNGWYEGYAPGIPSTSNATEASHTHTHERR